MLNCLFIYFAKKKKKQRTRKVKENYKCLLVEFEGYFRISIQYWRWKLYIKQGFSIKLEALKRRLCSQYVKSFLSFFCGDNKLWTNLAINFIFPTTRGFLLSQEGFHWKTMEPCLPLYDAKLGTLSFHQSNDCIIIIFLCVSVGVCKVDDWFLSSQTARIHID